MSELVVNLQAMAGSFALRAEFVVPAAGVTGLFGSSGSGKTTLLRCLAGLHRGRGTIRLGGAVLHDDTAARFVEPHDRGLGWISQDPDLFPHMTVRENIRYGARRAGQSGGSDWDGVIAETGVGALLDRRPAGLSGGERQRAALARTMLARPQLVLMDEPLSALDEPARDGIFACIDRLAHARGVPVIYVSHSLLEVSRLADRLIWLADGQVRRVGPVDEIVAEIDATRAREADAGVIVAARVMAHDDTWGTSTLESPFGVLTVPRSTIPPGTRVRVQVLASDVSLGIAPQSDSSIVNEFPMRVASISPRDPGGVLVRLEPGDGQGGLLLAHVLRRSADRLGITVGRMVFARVKGAAIVR